MGDDDLKQLIAELEAAFKLGKNRLSAISHLLIAVPFAFVMIFIGGALQRIWGMDGGLITSYLAPVVYLLSVFIIHLVASSQTNWLKSQLAQSRLIPEVLQGTEPSIKISQGVPRLFSIFLLIPGNPARFKDPRLRHLWRIGYNLDWYLNPVRGLVRPVWFAMVWLVILSIALGIVEFMYGFPASGGPLSTVTVLVLSIIPSLILGHDAIRRHQWTDLLLKHLQTMQEPTSDPATGVS